MGARRRGGFHVEEEETTASTAEEETNFEETNNGEYRKDTAGEGQDEQPTVEETSFDAQQRRTCVFR